MEVEYTTETEVNIMRCNVTPQKALKFQLLHYRYAPHNDVSVNDGPHIRRWSHNVIIYYNKMLLYIQNITLIIFYYIMLYYNTYHCVTIAYSIRYSNMLYRFVA